MQVFGLPRHVVRAGCAASRIAAKPPSSEAAIREATLARWMKLRSYGLTPARRRPASIRAARPCTVGPRRANRRAGARTVCARRPGRRR